MQRSFKPSLMPEVFYQTDIMHLHSLFVDILAVTELDSSTSDVEVCMRFKNYVMFCRDRPPPWCTCKLVATCSHYC